MATFFLTPNGAVLSSPTMTHRDAKRREYVRSVEDSRECNSTTEGPRENSGLPSVKSIDGEGMRREKRRRERDVGATHTDGFHFEKAEHRELCLGRASNTFVSTPVTLFPSSVI